MRKREQKIWTKPVVVFVVATLCCALWGSAFPCIKLGYRLFHLKPEDSASQMIFAGLRFVLAGAILIVMGSVIHRRLFIPRKKIIWQKAGVLSLFQTVLQYLFFYIGLAYASGVKSSIIQGSNVMVALFVSCFIFRLDRFQKNMPSVV